MTAKPFRATICLLSAAIVLLLALPKSSTQAASDEPDLPQIFRKMDVMIPMRDGVRLHTEIYIPRQASGPLPFIFERTA
jgi:hypothetical protein